MIFYFISTDLILKKNQYFQAKNIFFIFLLTKLKIDRIFAFHFSFSPSRKNNLKFYNLMTNLLTNIFKKISTQFTEKKLEILLYTSIVHFNFSFLIASFSGFLLEFFPNSFLHHLFVQNPSSVPQILHIFGGTHQ